MLITASFLFIFFAGQNIWAATSTNARTWEYVNLTTLLSPNWAFVVMPGHRYEFYRENGDKKKTFFHEAFAGPVYIQKFDNLTLKLGLWYYYMGFPIEATGDYFYSHNAEFLPIVEYKMGKFELSNRVIFHNTLYAKNTVFKEKEQRNGFSMLIREMVKVTYSLNDAMSVFVGEEVFYGVVEDGDTKSTVSGAPFFEKNGFTRNRVYLGLNYGIKPKIMTLTPQYVLESNYDPDNDHKTLDINHYINVTFTYVLKLY